MSKIIKRQGPLGQLDREISIGPSSLPWEDIPPDLHERVVQEYRVSGGNVESFSIPKGHGEIGGDGLLQRIANDTSAIASTLVLDRGLIGRVVLVPNTPVLIARAQFLRGYLFLNPALNVGLTTAGTLLSTTNLNNAVSPFNTTTLGVANYKTLRLTINITNFSGAGPVTFDAQTLDPVSASTWITTQNLLSATGNGNTYVNLGELGVDTDFRVRITIPAGTTLTASIGFILKDGLEGTSSGAAQTIFIGPSGVSASVGFPLLNGKEKAFYLRENTELYAVTDGPTLPLRVFEL
jgi:hypothetical protein